MTPAERLREAARLLREVQAGHLGPVETYEAVLRARALPDWARAPIADWLDLAALDIGTKVGGDEWYILKCFRMPRPGSPTHPAMRVADAVLGEL